MRVWIVEAASGPRVLILAGVTFEVQVRGRKGLHSGEVSNTPKALGGMTNMEN